MMMATKKDIKSAVKETIEQLEADSGPEDDEINLEQLEKRGIMHGPVHHRALQRAVDEVAIDELLLGIPKNEGYYLKLYRIDPATSEWQYRERFDNFHSCPDLEEQITQHVREKTKKAAHKWGTGKYVINVWRKGGVRGEKYKPVMLDIDAQEEYLPQYQQGNNGGQSQAAESTAHILESIKSFTDPNEYTKRLTETFNAGQQAKTSESNSIVVLVTAMMQQAAQAAQQQTTMMMAMMERMSNAVNTKPAVDPLMIEQMKSQGLLMQTLLAAILAKDKGGIDETLQKLQALGLLQKPEASDPVKRLGEMKSILDLVQTMSGGVTREKSAVEIIAESLTPHIPRITETINNAIDYNKAALAGRPVDVTPQPQQPQGSVPPQQPDANVIALFTRLKEAIEKQDKTSYPMLKSVTLAMQGGTELYHAILNGQVTIEQLTIMMQTGGTSVGLNNPQYEAAIKSYMSGFVEFLKAEVRTEQPKASSSVTLTGKCGLCGAVYQYNNMEEFNGDSKVCDEKIGGDSYSDGKVCGGVIGLVK